MIDYFRKPTHIKAARRWLLKTISAIIDRISDIFAYIAGLMLVYIVVSVTIDVVFRYLFNNPLPYTLDISEILLHFITFLTAAWVMKRDGHVKMDLVLAALKREHQLLINGLTSILSAIICFVICWCGSVVTFDFFQRNVHQGMMLELPRAPILSVIPLSFLFLFFQCIKKGLDYFQQWNRLRRD